MGIIERNELYSKGKKKYIYNYFNYTQLWNRTAAAGEISVCVPPEKNRKGIVGDRAKGGQIMAN